MILTDDTWHLVRNIRGVTGFVGEANKAIPLTEEEVAALGVEKREIVVLYHVGDTVKITDGPLASFMGTVEEIDADKNKVRVAVSMFGRETPIELELLGSGRGSSCRRSRTARQAGTFPSGASGRGCASRQERFPVFAGCYHIFMKEVPIHGTESCWLCKAADSCRQSDPAPPLSAPLWASTVSTFRPFTKEFNERTKNDVGMIIPVIITVYSDRSFSFITKTPPAAVLIKKECNIESGSGVPNKTKVATISKASIQKIAELKMRDLNAASLEAAMSMIAGTARSMGVVVGE